MIETIGDWIVFALIAAAFVGFATLVEMTTPPKSRPVVCAESGGSGGA